jgi:hypothetical protein
MKHHTRHTPDPYTFSGLPYKKLTSPLQHLPLTFTLDRCPQSHQTPVTMMHAILRGFLMHSCSFTSAPATPETFIVPLEALFKPHPPPPPSPLMPPLLRRWIAYCCVGPPYNPREGNLIIWNFFKIFFKLCYHERKGGFVKEIPWSIAHPHPSLNFWGSPIHTQETWAKAVYQFPLCLWLFFSLSP